MNIDDELREILQAEAGRVRPGPEGWERIRRGIAARRRRTAWLRGGAVVAGMATVAATALLTRTEPPRGLDPTDRPSPSASGRVLKPLTDEHLPFLWPFASAQDLHDWRLAPDRFPWAADPQEVVTQFARIYLDLANPTVLRDERPGWYAVQRTVEGRTFPVTRVRVSDLGSDGEFWVVTEVTAEAVAITEPEPAGAAPRPLVVRGTTKAVDSPIDVELRAAPDAAGRAEVLAKGRATIGPDGWSVTLVWQDPPTEAGSILVRTASGADGGIASATVRGVVLDPRSAPGVATPTFFGIDDARIAEFSVATGERIRFLTPLRPGGGVTAAEVSRDRSRLVYVEGAGTCAAGVWAIEVGDDQPKQLSGSDRGAVTWAAADPKSGRLARLVTRCEDGGDRIELAVTATDGTDSTTVAVPERTHGPIAWSRQHVVVVTGAGALWVLDLTGIRTEAEIRPDPGCAFTAVATRPDDTLVAAASCGDGVKLVDFDLELRETGRSGSLGGSRIVSLDADVSGRHLLIQRGDAAGTIETYTPGGAPRPIARGPQSPTW